MLPSFPSAWLIILEKKEYQDTVLVENRLIKYLSSICFFLRNMKKRFIIPSITSFPKVYYDFNFCIQVFKHTIFLRFV